MNITTINNSDSKKAVAMVLDMVAELENKNELEVVCSMKLTSLMDKEMYHFAKASDMTVTISKVKGDVEIKINDFISEDFVTKEINIIINAGDKVAKSLLDLCRSISNRHKIKSLEETIKNILK